MDAGAAGRALAAQSANGLAPRAPGTAQVDAFFPKRRRHKSAPHPREVSMQRRHMLASFAALSAGLAAGSTFAQETTKSTDPEMMGEAEMRHSQRTMKVGALSLAASRIAEKKANGPMVKQFAMLETAEQETIADVLMSMKKSESAARGALATISDAEVRDMLDADGRRMLEMLEGLSGEAFSKQYVAAQIEGHRMLLGIQEDYLKSGENREHLGITKLARGQIKEHLVLLDDIRTQLG
jgi:putative membrane protein